MECSHFFIGKKTHSTSRKWSATTSAVGGVEPSAAAQHLRSNGEGESLGSGASHEGAPPTQPAEHGGLRHGPRLYVCQGFAPQNTMRFIRVSPKKCAYTCVTEKMRLYVCHQMRLHVCHQMRLYVCHQMRPLSAQRSSLRSLTFARFARTFYNMLN